MESSLDIQGMELLMGDVWGHRKDLDYYNTTEDATVSGIRTLATSGVGTDEVAARFKRRRGSDLISSST